MNRKRALCDGLEEVCVSLNTVYRVDQLRSLQLFA